MTNLVSFPGLGLEFELSRVAVEIFGRQVYWYGTIIASGFLLAVLLCSKWSPRFGLTSDHIYDYLILAVPTSLVGARLYYVIFYLDLYRNADGSYDYMAMLRITDGGIAIYGAVMMCVFTLWLFCRWRKISFLAFADLGALGLFIGQLVGRWGNFMNVEAYGGLTDAPWRMCAQSIANSLLSQGYATQEQYQQILDGTLGVHPTFFYESMWNLVGVIALYFISRYARKFDGQIFLGYVLWYGIGRCWIEGLRTDSLYFFGLELFGYPIRSSQVLAGITAVGALVILIVRLRQNNDPAKLYVNRLAAQAKQEEFSTVTVEVVESANQPEDEELRAALDILATPEDEIESQQTPDKNPEENV